MTDEEAREALEEDLPKVSQFSPKLASAYKVAVSALSDEREPTDEEVIRYCNKRGYVICTQAVMNDPKREQYRIRFDGYVGIDNIGRYDPYTDSFVRGE